MFSKVNATAFELRIKFPCLHNCTYLIAVSFYTRRRFNVNLGEDIGEPLITFHASLGNQNKCFGLAKFIH